VNGIEQVFMKYLEPVNSLPSDRFGGTKGIDAPCLGIVTFPNLLVRIRRVIVLLEGEIPPRYRKFLICFFLYISQPDRCVIDERSEIIEIDIEFGQFDFQHITLL